jgi:hypothetical protein
LTRDEYDRAAARVRAVLSAAPAIQRKLRNVLRREPTAELGVFIDVAVPWGVELLRLTESIEASGQAYQVVRTTSAGQVLRPTDGATSGEMINVSKPDRPLDLLSGDHADLLRGHLRRIVAEANRASRVGHALTLEIARLSAWVETHSPGGKGEAHPGWIDPKTRASQLASGLMDELLREPKPISALGSRAAGELAAVVAAALGVPLGSSRGGVEGLRSARKRAGKNRETRAGESVGVEILQPPKTYALRESERCSVLHGRYGETERCVYVSGHEGVCGFMSHLPEAEQMALLGVRPKF